MCVLSLLQITAQNLNGMLYKNNKSIYYPFPMPTANPNCNYKFIIIFEFVHIAEGSPHIPPRLLYIQQNIATNASCPLYICIYSLIYFIDQYHQSYSWPMHIMFWCNNYDCVPVSVQREYSRPNKINFW